jgi:L-asparaginase II
VLADPRVVPVATVLRGGRAESWHHGAAAVATPDGRLVARAGDPLLATFARSAAKPFQAMTALGAGIAERYALDQGDVAVAGASHGGTPAHTARVAAMLARAGLGERDLRCGPHPPLDPAAARELVRDGVEPGALHNNCSGKHAAMLLACRERGDDLAGYLAPGHPLQRDNLLRVARLCGVAPAELAFAVDGCGVPTYHLPLAALALGYARLADPRRGGLAGDEAAAAERVVSAMTEVPQMVAGPGRFTTRLMEVTGGRLLGKEGAEALYAVAVRGPVALGVAVKIADGGERARDGVVLDVLRQLGSLAGAELAELASFHRPRLRNCAGREVGEIVADVELEEVEG